MKLVLFLLIATVVVIQAQDDYLASDRDAGALIEQSSGSLVVDTSTLETSGLNWSKDPSIQTALNTVSTPPKQHRAQYQTFFKNLRAQKAAVEDAQEAGLSTEQAEELAARKNAKNYHEIDDATPSHKVIQDDQHKPLDNTHYHVVKRDLRKRECKGRFGRCNAKHTPKRQRKYKKLKAAKITIDHVINKMLAREGKPVPSHFTTHAKLVPSLKKFRARRRAKAAKRAAYRKAQEKFMK